eukprot:5650123-Alexandrium_andersonii.AAC.1
MLNAAIACRELRSASVALALFRVTSRRSWAISSSLRHVRASPASAHNYTGATDTATTESAAQRPTRAESASGRQHLR